MERSDFENEWQGALAQAEVVTQPWVWDNLERELLLKENEGEKKRVVFYQRVAAACVLFALMAGSFGIYHWKENGNPVATTNHKIENGGSDQHQPAQTNIASNRNAEPKNNEASGSKPSFAEATEGKEKSISTKQFSLKQASQTRANEKGLDQHQLAQSDFASNKNTEHKNNEASGSKPILKGENSVSTGMALKNFSGIALAKKETTTSTNEPIVSSIAEKKTKASDENYFASLDLPSLPQLDVAQLNGGPTYVELVRKLPFIPLPKEDKKNYVAQEKLWASVQASSGSYSEGSGGTSSAAFALSKYYVSSGYNLSSTTPQAVSGSASGNTSTSVGKSNSYGVIGGVRLAKRWVLQSGVQYINQSINSSSGVATQTYSSTASSLTSTNEFVSVPVQMGYLLIDRRIGLQLNPGVATDFFLRNTVSGQQQTFTQGAGSDSPYRSVNFAGLMSSELSYKLGKNYRVSVLPGFRYSASPVLKSQSSGNPLVWDVGFRLRYIFR